MDLSGYIFLKIQFLAQTKASGVELNRIVITGSERVSTQPLHNIANLCTSPQDINGFVDRLSEEKGLKLNYRLLKNKLTVMI